jgi:T5SS/PEP-CTERM-associated repeat protein
MAGSTWTWNGGTAGGSSNNWTLTSGPGNAKQGPQAGDTAIVSDGTVLVGSDPSFEGNTIEIGGTAGAQVALVVSGDASTTFATPSADSATLITTAVPGQTTPEIAALDTSGIFINDGTILADGPVGSALTITVPPTLSGTTTLPGTFINDGTLQADAGNTLIIDIAGTAALFNPGTIVADGGSVIIDAAPNAIAGGYMPVRGLAVIEADGTLETNAASASGTTDNGNGGVYYFGDQTPGNTLKIDNIGSFAGRIGDFSAGDTIDLGTSLAIGTLVDSSQTDFLYLESNGGTILASLDIATGAFGSGTYAVSNGTVDGFTIGSIVANGTTDTVLTTTLTTPASSNASGTWQAGGSWRNGAIPGAADTPQIGWGATANFILTTGAAPVSTGAVTIASPFATVEVTSDTSAGAANISNLAGTLIVTAGNTLTAGQLLTTEASAAVTIAAGATIALSGRPNLNLAPVLGDWTVQSGNTTAANFFAGSVTIDGALLAGPQTAAGGGGSTSIGYDGDGQPATVTVNTGGTVTDTHTTMGSDPTSAGSLILNGAGAGWTDEIDAADPLNTRGYVLVGYNDLAPYTPAGLAQPAPLAPAQLLIENGATMTEQAGAYVAYSVASGGNVTVEAGGLWNLAYNGKGFLNVGYIGSGSLSVLNGGSVAIGAVGTFLSNGLSYTAGGIGVGQSIGATGSVIVSGAGSELSTFGGMAVGKGGQGLLELLNGGTVLIGSGGLSVGTTADGGSSGTIVVGGSGGAAALDFAATASGLTVGSASQGTLIVADNGTVNLNNTSYLTIGGSGGAVGEVLVGGTSARAVINIGTAGLTVGNAGTAYLEVDSLGTIAMGGTRAIVMGQSAGAMGVITVNGTSASLSAGGGIDVGWQGQATLTVADGGAVSTTSLVLDGQPGGPLGSLSDVVAIAAGGQLKATDALYVWQGSTVSVDGSAGSGIDIGSSGDFTTGVINVENGHSIVGNGLIAASVFNSGVIAASSAYAPAALAFGTLEIQGSVAGSGVIDIGADAIIRLDGSVGVGQQAGICRRSCRARRCSRAGRW